MGSSKNKNLAIITTLLKSVGRGSLLLLAGTVMLTAPNPVQADSLQDQINALQAQVNGDQQNASALASRASDLAAQITALQDQIVSTQVQINLSQSQLTELTAQIEAAQKELDYQRKVLGDNIRAMYIEGQVSTVEMLASSKNISNYLDKQQYRDSVKDKVSETVKKISDLKKELGEKKDRVAKLLEDQQKQKASLASSQSQLNGVLSQTNAEKTAVDASIQEKQGKIAELRRQQAALNMRYSRNVSYGGTGGYPWDDEGFPCSGADPWGMCYRQCVSYTAWKVASTSKNGMPTWGFTGPANAKDWIWRAQADGIPVDFNAKAGTIAIDPNGYYGHAMYVEAVMGDYVRVSQYNGNWDGRFSYAERPISGLYFIHFP